MTVFKHYMKITRQYLPVIFLYIGIFTFFALVATTSSANTANFTDAKPKIAIQNNDRENSYTSFLIDFIKEKSEWIEIAESEINDALFYRKIDAAITIPENFGTQFEAGTQPTLPIQKVPDSYASTYIEMNIERFLSIMNTLVKSGMSESEIASVQKEIRKQATEVTLESNNQTAVEKVSMFYNFANYSLLALSIFIIGMIMATFKEPKIKDRNTVAPISYRRINRQLFLGNLCITQIIWLFHVILSFLLFPKTMITENGLLILLNSFCFNITALSIGFFIGSVVRNKEAQSGIVNVFALGTSFICGAFVPQQYLGSFVLSIAKIFPSYWYIKVNNDLTLLSEFSFSTLFPIFQQILIVLLFGLGFFLLTNLYSRIKRKRAS